MFEFTCWSAEFFCYLLHQKWAVDRKQVTCNSYWFHLRLHFKPASHPLILPLQVNGVRVALPHSPSPLMSLTLAGQYITLQTPFGLQVRWDGNHYAQISVPRLVYKSVQMYFDIAEESDLVFSPCWLHATVSAFFLCFFFNWKIADNCFHLLEKNM